MSDDLEWLIGVLQQLQVFMEGEARKFGNGRDSAVVREVVEAWEAVNVSAAEYLTAVRAAYRMAGH